RPLLYAHLTSRPPVARSDLNAGRSAVLRALELINGRVSPLDRASRPQVGTVICSACFEINNGRVAQPDRASRPQVGTVICSACFEINKWSRSSAGYASPSLNRGGHLVCLL